MCLSCGCGRPHDTHGDSRHITYEDVVAAGQAADLAPGEAASNIASTFRQMTEAEPVTKAWGDAWETEARGLGGRWESGSGGSNLSQSDFRSYSGATTESTADEAAKAVAGNWNVSDADLHALAAEEGISESTNQLSGSALKESMAQYYISRWQGSSGGPVAVAAAAHVADEHGLSYQLSDREAVSQEFIKNNPALDRATSSFGDAMYRTTQGWLAQRGITQVNVMRQSRFGAALDETRPFTSWSTGWGGVRHEAGGTFREATIPASRILSVPPTGFGTLAESEVVVLPPSGAKKLKKISLTPRDLNLLQAITTYDRQG
jgi:hypothetical protein